MSLVYDLNIEALKEKDKELYDAVMNTTEMDIEIVQSKNGYAVPKFNGNMIHSSYDPIKEAVAFINSCETVINMQEMFIVMGFGFGYHVDELTKRIGDKENSHVFVIEPNISFFKKMLHYKDITPLLDDVTFIVGISIEALFAISDFYKILNASPYTIGFKPALIISEEYFTEFVKRRSSNKVQHLLLEADEDDGLKEIFDRFDKDEELDLPKIIKSILAENTPLSDREKIFLLMGELAG